MNEQFNSYHTRNLNHIQTNNQTNERMWDYFTYAARSLDTTSMNENIVNEHNFNINSFLDAKRLIRDALRSDELTEEQLESLIFYDSTEQSNNYTRYIISAIASLHRKLLESRHPLQYSSLRMELNIPDWPDLSFIPNTNINNTNVSRYSNSNTTISYMGSNNEGGRRRKRRNTNKKNNQKSKTIYKIKPKTTKKTRKTKKKNNKFNKK